MKLIDEIIELASGEQGSVATILRKCLVLAHTLKNDRLKAWAENELNGYRTDNDEAVPEYRKTSVTAKGLFIGSFGAQINNQPTPSNLQCKIATSQVISCSWGAQHLGDWNLVARRELAR